MSGLGVRRGAWTPEEDKLLKECIEKYGVGKWNEVVTRSGLNRCRKSCRLRWLDYLQPNIKRGGFGEDEVDLICKLHKLLGNRWSLIAGRLPGRTANGVKNYWNSHMRKKQHQKVMCHKASSHHQTTTPNKEGCVIVKPQPWRFSKTSLASLQKKLSVQFQHNFHCDRVKNDTKQTCSPYSFELQEDALSISSWWEDLLQKDDNFFVDQNADDGSVGICWSDVDAGTTTAECNEADGVVNLDDQELYFNIQLWDS
uniref:Uncharacterized protein n=1 Tax=Kalanchoe fedtschenkoi TaxID=63787 RepID=A0A7N0UKU5_KALFE